MVELPARSAPLGLILYGGSLLPARCRGGLVVAYHGSTYRTLPTGYKVVHIPVHRTRAGSPQHLITEWLTSVTSYAFCGRPVGVLVATDGSLLVSDDGGVISHLAPLGR